MECRAQTVTNHPPTWKLDKAAVTDHHLMAARKHWEGKQTADTPPPPADSAAGGGGTYCYQPAEVAGIHCMSRIPWLNVKCIGGSVHMLCRSRVRERGVARASMAVELAGVDNFG